jgi:hypothetical protein
MTTKEFLKLLKCYDFPTPGNKLRGLFCLQANYTDRAATLVPTFASRECCVVSAVDLGFPDWSCYVFIQVAHQISTQGWVVPIPGPLLLRKSCSTRNPTQDLWSNTMETVIFLKFQPMI